MNKWAAYELFGPMRSSSLEEQEDYEKMQEKYSVPLGFNIFDIGEKYMGEIEIDYCDMCHQKKEVERTYYYYPIDCECCGGKYHFEIIKHCRECEPRPPKWIRAQVIPIE